MNLMPAIVQVVAGKDFTVYAYCNDGAVRLIDVKPLIKKGGVFSKISDYDFFCESLTVMNDTVACDIAGNRDSTMCIDLDPFVIFETAKIVDDPLIVNETA